MMKELWEACAVAFSMYSAIPVPQVEWNKKNMRYCMCFFPAVGLVIGLIELLWARVCMVHFGTLMRVVVQVLIPVAVTGGIHLDGLLDTADAAAAHATPEKRREILKDSRCGAFAVLACVCYFLLSLAAWSEMVPDKMPAAVLIPVVSRALSAYALMRFPKAAGSGLAKTFSDAAMTYTVARVSSVTAGAGMVLLVWFDHRGGAVAAVLALVCLRIYRRRSERDFGGLTGDLAGCFLQMTELAMLLGLALV